MLHDYLPLLACSFAFWNTHRREWGGTNSLRASRVWESSVMANFGFIRRNVAYRYAYPASWCPLLLSTIHSLLLFGRERYNLNISHRIIGGFRGRICSDDDSFKIKPINSRMILAYWQFLVILASGWSGDFLRGSGYLDWPIQDAWTTCRGRDRCLQTSKLDIIGGKIVNFTIKQFSSRPIWFWSIPFSIRARQGAVLRVPHVIASPIKKLFCGNYKIW